MKQITTKTTYLEMLSPSMPSMSAPSAEIVIERLSSPTVEGYRSLYHSVGGDYHWVDRILLDDDKLLQTITDEKVEIYELKVCNVPAGFSELDRRTPNQIEVAYFGLCPDFIGKGLGKFFLFHTLEIAWSHQPNRVWLHTCDLDHPAALPNYLKAGFSIYDEKFIQQDILQ